VSETAAIPPNSAPDAAAAPPGRRRTYRILAAVLAVGIGALGGLGIFTFGYGQGASYLSNDPNACTNCHVMQGHFDSWEQSSHRHVAVCNDCHLPHHPIGKWVTKGDNGFFHSLAFTLGDFHEPIQIKPRNRRVTQGACLHCHADFVHEMLPAERGGDMLMCIDCHSDVGHAHRGRGRRSY
jgi:cytochrome c nitrite reductase small subunit